MKSKVFFVYIDVLPRLREEPGHVFKGAVRLPDGGEAFKLVAYIPSHGASGTFLFDVLDGAGRKLNEAGIEAVAKTGYGHFCPDFRKRPRLVEYILSSNCAVARLAVDDAGRPVRDGDGGFTFCGFGF